MRVVTLLLKVMPKSVSLFALMESSFILSGLSLKSEMGQLQVGCRNAKVTNIYINYVCVCAHLMKHTIYLHYYNYVALTYQQSHSVHSLPFQYM